MARRSRYASPTRRAGSLFLAGTGGPHYRRRRRVTGRRVLGGALAVVLLAAVAGGVVLWRRHVDAVHARRVAAVSFFRAWARDDLNAMWHTLTPAARERHPRAAFVAAYRHAAIATTQRGVRMGRVGSVHHGAVSAPVRVATRDFGTLRGTVALPVSGSGSDAGVDWDASLRLPGLRHGEAVRQRAGTPPARASVLAADGTRLDATPLGAGIAGHAPPHATGLERIFNARLAGHPSERLVFGRRVIARATTVRGRSVRTTLEPRLIAAAATALGNKLGGVAVIRPRDGAVTGLAGLAVSAPQPPGSTFKMVTVSAALEHHVATPGTTFPVATSATLSGVKLSNAHGESCGGTLTRAFIESCNSVFAPLGAKIGARLLVATAQAFGFGARPPIPAAKASTLAAAGQLRDDLAVGSAAIGQERDLATPLQMASVAATIATGGRRARPRITRLTPAVRHRAIPASVARQVRAMMIGVVRSGTGTAAALPGVQVAGKTGTAELRPNSKNPKDADAWFAAFAPARHPRVAVAVMLVGAGFGGTAAAPIARSVLAAALG
jgi:hypothetical protein